MMLVNAVRSEPFIIMNGSQVIDVRIYPGAWWLSQRGWSQANGSKAAKRVKLVVARLCVASSAENHLEDDINQYRWAKSKQAIPRPPSLGPRAFS